MRSKLKLFSVVFLVAAFMLGSSIMYGAGEEEAAPVMPEFRIGVSQMWGSLPFLQTVLAGHRAEAEKWEREGKARVVELFVTDAGLEDPSIQATDMEDLYARKIDGLIVFPGDSDIVGEVIVNLYNKNNIPVVVTDIGVSKVILWVFQ
jgi:ribose transport system substrate-binding protein